jgi:hypothetical protein
VTPAGAYLKFLLYLTGTAAMRLLIPVAAAVLLASASAAAAAPASVHVTISPELRAKAVKTYGVRDVERLADYLKTSVARQLARTGAYDGNRIELELSDAVPNRPTFKQLGDVPGLSMQSVGVGGADIEGQSIAPNGDMRPISYRWYETDIRQSAGTATWHDAEWTIDRFAHRLAREREVASR